jgi:hypothetical protein
VLLFSKSETFYRSSCVFPQDDHPLTLAAYKNPGTSVTAMRGTPTTH